MLYEAVKRATDVLAAAALLFLALPVFAVAALAVVATDGRPVLYVQERSGRHGRTFRLYKFRSMRKHDLPPEAVGQVGAGHRLVTPIGRVLRRLKIDELPQLWNVLRGDMSLVGPRPTLPEQTARYSERERRRLAVRPGITGWAQVNGNVQLTWDERIALDLWYLDHRSLGLDLRILLRTLSVVVGGERTNPNALATALEHEDGTRRGGGKH